MMNFKSKNKKNGFALLFTILIITLVLSMGLGISNTTFKQSVLSSLAKDSQTAFFEADAGVECGLSYMLKFKAFDQGWDPATANDNVPVVTCGNESLVIDSSDDGNVSNDDYFLYRNSSAQNSPCTEILFDLRSWPTVTIESHGFSFCKTDNPRRVERTLRVTY